MRPRSPYLVSRHWSSSFATSFKFYEQSTHFEEQSTNKRGVVCTLQALCACTW